MAEQDALASVSDLAPGDKLTDEQKSAILTDVAEKKKAGGGTKAALALSPDKEGKASTAGAAGGGAKAALALKTADGADSLMARESERYKEEAEKFKAELAARELAVMPGGARPAERAEATADAATAETHVFRRIRDAPDDVRIDPSARTCTFASGFSTIAAPDKISTEGIAYFEVEVLEAG